MKITSHPFTSEVSQFVRSSFYYLEKDIYGEDRIFFENSGGSLRLKKVVEEDAKYASYPDCPERTHKEAQLLKDTIAKGIEDIRLFLNAKDGSILPGYTASEIMYEMVRTIAENTSGTNIVTTAIEHPSSYDACKMYAEKTGKELRVANANPVTGGVEVEEITSLIDKDTSLLSVIHTSNLTGAMLDIETIIKKAREINPELYVIVDAVQCAPHHVIDVECLKVDGLNIAPYKMFGNRGMAFAYVSERISSFPHPRLLATKEDNWIIGSPTPAHFAGFTQIVNYICTIGSFYTKSTDRRELIVKGMTRIHKQEKALLERMLFGSNQVCGIKDLKGVTLHFAEQNIENQDCILAITFDNLSPTKAVEKYGEKNIRVYDRVDSSFYSKRILNAVNLNGIVRVSPLHCHTVEEIDAFLKVTEEIANNQ